LSAGDRRRLLVLGLPTFGMALSVTISTYLPVLASGHRASRPRDRQGVGGPASGKEKTMEQVVSHRSGLRRVGQR